MNLILKRKLEGIILLLFIIFLLGFLANASEANAFTRENYKTSKIKELAQPTPVADKKKPVNFNTLCIVGNDLYGIVTNTTDDVSVLHKITNFESTSRTETYAAVKDKSGKATSIGHANGMAYYKNNFYVATGKAPGQGPQLVILSMDGTVQEKINYTSTIYNITDYEGKLLGKFNSTYTPFTVSNGKITPSGSTFKVDQNGHTGQDIDYRDGFLRIILTHNGLNKIYMIDLRKGIQKSSYTPVKIIDVLTPKEAAYKMEIESIDYKDNKVYCATNVRKDPNNTGVITNTVYQIYKQTYTVVYNANGGSGKMANTIINYGVAGQPLAKNTFTRSGYTFTGWNAHRASDNKWYYTKGTSTGWYKSGAQPSGYTKTLYKDGVAVSKTTSVHKDTVTMYAQWKKK